MMRLPIVLRCRRRRRDLPLVVCLAVALFSAGLARAEAEPDAKAAAKAEVQKAQLHYKLGRFDEALAAYSRAYEIFNAPALLFNIGQCHKNLKNYDRAIFFFEGYLREETRADPQKRRLAEELIAESRAQQDRQRAEAAAAADAQAAERRAAATATGPGPASTPAASSVAAVFGPPPAPPASTGSLLDSAPPAAADKPLVRKWWFWTALGVGTLAVVGAVAYYSSAPTTIVPAMGTVGVLDRRGAP